MPRASLQKIREIWKGFTRTSAGVHASSIAFFFFLSVIPLVIIYAWIVASAGQSQEAVNAFFVHIVPAPLEDFVGSVVDEAYEKSGIAFSVSLLTLLWTASRGARVLRGGLNAVYEIEETRNRAIVTAISIVATIILIALLSAAVYLIFNVSIRNAFAQVVPGVSVPNELERLFNGMLMLVFGTVVFAGCYTYLPAGKRTFAKQLPGAACAAIAWSILSFGFQIYVDHFSNYTLLYGSLATVALFLFWLYLVFYILLAGGFINCCLAHTDEAERE